MPRLAFEEPKGGPRAKAALLAAQAAQEEHAHDVRRAPYDEHEQQHDDGLVDLLDDEPEPVGTDRDRILLIMKAATIAVAVALVGAVVLLATAGGEGPSSTSPDVPLIDDSRPAAPPASTSASTGEIIAPEVRSQTAAITPSTTTPPPVTEPTVPTGPPSQDEFVRVGDPCDTRGAYAFTERFQPVMCDARGPGGSLSWRPLFR